MHIITHFDLGLIKSIWVASGGLLSWLLEQSDITRNGCSGQRITKCKVALQSQSLAMAAMYMHLTYLDDNRQTKCQHWTLTWTLTLKDLSSKGMDRLIFELF